MFDRSKIFRSDRYGGEFVEFDGQIVEVNDPDPGAEYHVWVQTPEGRIDGFTHKLSSGFPPKIGQTATIRIYNAGGGWYPDNRITSWCFPE